MSTMMIIIMMVMPIIGISAMATSAGMPMLLLPIIIMVVGAAVIGIMMLVRVGSRGGAAAAGATGSANGLKLKDVPPNPGVGGSGVEGYRGRGFP